jgi:cobalt-zinc-cadmium efflux system membrane fusion protein
MRGKIAILAVSCFAAGGLLAAVALRHLDHDPPSGRESHKDEAHGEEDAHGSHDASRSSGALEERVARISEEHWAEFGIDVDEARAGKIEFQVSLPGEVVTNEDRLVHVVPRVSGVVAEVLKSLGDMVRAGETLAVLESRELADLKSAFLAAVEKEKLAKTNLAREDELWRKRISAEQDYLEAKKSMAEAAIERRSAEQKLHAVGFSEAQLSRLPQQPETDYTKYLLVAPLEGTVIKKHITRGEVLKEDTETFVIADLTTVWVNVRVYQKDMPHVRKGQTVTVSASHEIPDAQGAIWYVEPLVDEKTRTGLARILLANPKGEWRPGLFITARIAVQSIDVPLLVSKTALQTIDEKTCVFVRTNEGFVPRPVTVGRSDGQKVEITHGLRPGESYAAQGAFAVKAQLSKGTLAEGHAH